MRNSKLFGVFLVLIMLSATHLFAQTTDRLQMMKVKSIYKFLDQKVEGIPNGWGKIKFGMKLAAFRNFFYTDYFGPGGKLLGVGANEVMLGKVGNSDVRDVTDGTALREKGTQPIERYDFYFFEEKFFMIKVYYDESMGVMPWEMFLDERKREFGAPSQVSETKAGVSERWAIWENDQVLYKVIFHFGKYDITIHDKVAMAKVEAKAAAQ
jgi:hypothetical protein